MTTFKDRVPYSAIIDRPPLKLPGGARMVVWTIVNVEHWDCTGAMPRAVLLFVTLLVGFILGMVVATRLERDAKPAPLPPTPPPPAKKA